jgi:Sporulation and spore germination
VTRRRPFAVGAVAVVAVTTVVGCAVPTDEKFKVIAPEDAPYAIETTVVPETTAIPDETIAPLAVYLVDPSGNLVRKRVADVPSISGGLDLLMSPDVATDTSLRSAVPAGSIVDVTVTGQSLVSVDLDPAFVDLPADEQRLAIAQIVLTASDRVRTILVGFSIAGEPIEVPRGDSSVGGGTVNRADYESLLTPAG